MICLFEFYFHCWCILFYLSNKTVAIRDTITSKTYSSNQYFPSTRPGVRSQMTKTGTLEYRQPTDALYASYDHLGLHICVAKCFMLRRCNSITYDLQTMNCGLLVASSSTADFRRDDGTTDTVFTDLEGWRSEEGERCKATCLGTCRCLKSRKESIVCVGIVDTYAAGKGTPIAIHDEVSDMSASISHPGYVYYLKKPYRKKIFMANVRETNADATNTDIHPSINVGKHLLHICVGPTTRPPQITVYVLSFNRKLYQFEEPKHIDNNTKTLHVTQFKIRCRDIVTRIQVLDRQLIAIGGSSDHKSHIMCHLRVHRLPRSYSCANRATLHTESRLACFQLQYGMLQLISSYDLLYRDRLGRQDNRNEFTMFETHVYLSRQPSLYLFSIDGSQLYVLFKRQSKQFLERFHRKRSS